MFSEYESSKVYFKGKWAAIVTLIMVFMSLFHMYYNSYGSLMSIQFRAAHLAFVLALIFLIYPSKKGVKKVKPSKIDVLLAILGACIALYMFFIYNVFAISGKLPDTKDIVIAVVGILLIFEAVRRAAGMALVILSIIFLLYARFGNLAPGGFKIVPFTFERIIYQIFYTDTGIFGTVLGVSATFIFLFILFGAFLGENKSSDFFNDLSLAAAGSKPGGPAKVALLGSAIMGTISGSAVANVATTGTITIPLMKKVGYKSHFAGAVEAVASSGGSIMPPVMASAAFIMAEILGVSYTVVIKAALIPALLYYLAVWVMVDLEAKKLDLKGLPKDEIPDLKHVLKTRGHLVIPVLILMYLLISGRTPLFAGFWGIISTIVVSSIKDETRLSIAGIMVALREGAIASLSAASTCAIVGIIIGVTSMTGLGPMFANNIVSMAQGNVFLAMVLTAIACLILGMGLPTAACYITAAVVAAPALIRMGILPIAAHLFVLYYAILSNLTPPVALASFTAAGIADANLNKVALTGLKLGSAGFIVPFMFCYSPILLLEGQFYAVQLIITLITAGIGIIALGASMDGYFITKLNIIERNAFFIAAILTIKPGIYTDLAGLLILAILIMTLRIKSKGREKMELDADN